MLAKQFRLPASLRLNGFHTIRQSAFLVKYQHNTLPNSRFGFVVSKKIDKRASARNRVKRMARARIEKKWLATKGYDVLFVFQAAIVRQTPQDIAQALDSVMADIQKS